MESGKHVLISTLESLNGVTTEIAQILPNIISSLIILIIGVALAYSMRWCGSLLVKGILRLLPSSMTSKEFVKNILEPLALGAGRLLFFLTIFVAIAVSFKKLGLKIISDWMQNLGKYLPNIVGSLLILFVGWKAKEIVERLTYKALRRTELRYSSVISNILGWSIFVISSAVALEQIGIDMSLVISVATVLIGVAFSGVALTFALGAKATISDILYCYQLQKYIKVGQELKLRGIKGIIKSIGPVFILVETEKGVVTIPGNVFNGEMAEVSECGGRINV